MMEAQKIRRIKRARGIEAKAYELLGDEWGGNASPPGVNVKGTSSDKDGTDKVYSFWGNDGFDLGIGYPDKWLVHLNHMEMKVLYWTITKYYISTWFGLRRYVWYKLLHRKVARYQSGFPVVVDNDS